MSKEINTVIVTERIGLYPVGDKQEVNRVYKFIKNGMLFQSQCMNIAMSSLYSIYINNPIKNREWDLLDEELRLAKEAEALNKRDILRKDCIKLMGRNPNKEVGYSLYDNLVDNSLHPTGLSTCALISNVIPKYFDKAIGDGLLYGKVSLPTYKADIPLMIQAECCRLHKKHGGLKPLGFYHDYDTDEEFYQAILKEDKPKVYYKFVNGIVFELILGNPKKSLRLRQYISDLFQGVIKGCQSTRGFDSTGRKIVLNWPIEVEKKINVCLDENRVIGVDLGLAVPVVCATNFDIYKREKIGSYDDFIRKRIFIQNNRRHIMRNLKIAKGGHGRTKKLHKLEQLKNYERNFVKSYNHMLSKKIVDFALKNNAKYINIEDLSGFSEKERNNFVLRNWSYYQLQMFIEYKASFYGIIVRKVCPLYTSQVCSICGHKGIRETQAIFKCTNPECKSKKLYDKGSDIGADFNAARNIAMSTNFVDNNIVKLLSIEKNYVFDGQVLLDKDKKYNFIVNKNGIVKVMCDDNYFHEFDIMDLEYILGSINFNILKSYVLSKPKIKKK